MPEDTPLEDQSLDQAERARVAARLADMRGVLAEEDYQAFLEKACAELHALAEHAEPWPKPLVERAIASAMFLGFDSLEAACRGIAETGAARPRPPQAARAAAAALNAFRTQSRH